MSYSYVAMSFRSLPKEIKKAITDKVVFEEFEAIVKKTKYSHASRVAGVHHYRRINDPSYTVETRR